MATSWRERIGRNLRRLSLIAPLELLRLSRFAHHRETTTFLFGKPLRLADVRTFLGGLDEIFFGKIYDFQPRARAPVIFDCGANIGLSCIFFKRRFPEATIIAFEPAPGVFRVLAKNIESFGLTKVELRNEAVWVADSQAPFLDEGAYSGRLARADEIGAIEVKTVRLRSLLEQHVDLLKLDIEGAEENVLRDCADRLINIDHLFVEYHCRAREPQGLHELLRIIHAAGFRYHLKEAFCAAAPFISRPLMLGFDMQLNIFAFRE